MEKNNLDFCVEDDKKKIFSLIFDKEENYIRITCKDLDSKSNEMFTNELSLNEWKTSSAFLSSIENLNDVFNKIKVLKGLDFSIKKRKNEIELKIKFADKYNAYPVKIKLVEKKIFKSKNLEKNENIIIGNDKNKKLEERMDILEDHLQKILLSLPFNSFDNSLYQLEKVFNTLDSYELISKREYLGFINSGIKHYYDKNIRDCNLICKYPPIDNNNNPYIFKEQLNYLKYPLIIVKTMQNKIFGTFYEKNNNQMFIAGGGAQMAYSNNYGFGQFQLFDSREQKNKSFIFSLGNKLKIFFSDDEDSYKKPDFLINYNSNRLFYGNEYISPINGFGNTTPIITANYSTKTMQTTYTNNKCQHLMVLFVLVTMKLINMQIQINVDLRLFK